MWTSFGPTARRLNVCRIMRPEASAAARQLVEIIVEVWGVCVLEQKNAVGGGQEIRVSVLYEGRAGGANLRLGERVGWAARLNQAMCGNTRDATLRRGVGAVIHATPGP